MRERLEHWWRSRSDRERRFLAAWGGAVAALLVWFGGISPLTQRIALLEKRIPELSGLLMRIQASPPATAATVRGSSGGDLRSSLLGILAERGVHAELNPVSSSRVEMRLTELPVRDALTLVDSLRQASEARVFRLDVQVDARAVARTVVELERAP